jgi:predicted ATP-dependent serine protease
MTTQARTSSISVPVPVPVLPVSALTLLNQPKRKPSLYLLRSSSSSPSFFELGLGITEIAGMAGSGKTQMALALCVQAASISPEAPQHHHHHQQQQQKALYLSLGEGTTQPKLAQRLAQMAGSSLDPLQHIFTRIVHNPDDLLELLMGDLPAMLQQHNFRIIVLDSIAGIFRVPETSIAQRSETFFRVASILKKLSDQYNIPVLVVNQVTASFSANNAVLPALGLSWEHCVNTSHLLARTETSRSITVRLSSNLLVGTSRRFAIHSSGPIEVLDY